MEKDMLKKLICALSVAGALGLAPGSRADVWDQATDGDDGSGTDTALAHGVEQVHDLAAQGIVPDQDWFILTANGHSSYEMLIDNTTGDLNLGADDVTRVGSDGIQTLQSAEVT